MAKIIENNKGRRMVKLNPNDIINVVREYQNISVGVNDYNELRGRLNNFEIYLPEDLF